MTALFIEMMMKWYTGATYPEKNESVTKVVKFAMQHNLVIFNTNDVFSLTPKGEAYVKMLLQVPLPIQRSVFVNPLTHEIVE